MTVVHGPRRAGAGTYDAWSEVLRAADPGFAFADPPLRHSLPMSLAFAAAASRPTAVLTGPYLAMGSTGTAAGEPRMAGAYDMVEVTVAGHPLAATAGLVWNTDMPRQLQQILFDTADGVGCVLRALVRRPAGRRRSCWPSAILCPGVSLPTPPPRAVR